MTGFKLRISGVGTTTLPLAPNPFYRHKFKVLLFLQLFARYLTTAAEANDVRHGPPPMYEFRLQFFVVFDLKPKQKKEHARCLNEE